MAFSIFSRMRKKLLGPAATRDYKQVRYEAFTEIRDLPVFSFEWARLMLVDPTIRLGLAMRAAPLAQAQFGHQEKDDEGNSKFVPGVRSPNEEVAIFVEKQLERIWVNELHKVTTAQIWGWSAGEITYRLDSQSGMVVVDKLLKRASRDVLALTRDGELAGVRFKRIVHSPSGTVDLEFPRAWWHTFDMEDENPYGLSVLRGAFSPWADKWLAGGANDVRRLFAHKDAYGGVDMTYPPGTTNINGEEIPNRDIAREISEQLKAGGVTQRPSLRDPSGNEQWTITRAVIPSNPTHIFEYPKDLDTEMMRGLEIPDDMLLSDATGAWQGKQVPMLAFFTNADRWLNQLICMFVHQVLEPLVLMNWGEAIDFEVRAKPLAEQAMEQMKGDDPDDEQIGQPIGQALAQGPPQQPAAPLATPQPPPRPRSPQLPTNVRLSLTPDVSVAEQLVGTGTIQAKHLVEAGRRMMGLDDEGIEATNGHAPDDDDSNEEDEELSVDDIADMFSLDDSQRRILEN